MDVSPLPVRRIVTTAAGFTVTYTWSVTWSNPLDPCADIALGSPVILIVAPASTNAETWRIRFTNGSDKGNVLYQNGYQQSLFLLMQPVYDVPEVNRDVVLKVNGYGQEFRRFSRTVERLKFEASDLPDYALAFLAKAGDMDTVVLEEINSGNGYTLVNLEAEFRRQGAALNIGVFSFERGVEVFSGCQTNFALV